VYSRFTVTQERDPQDGERSTHVVHRFRPGCTIRGARAQAPTVHPRIDVPPSLLRLAQAQSGVLSREQTQIAGLSPNVIARLIKTHQWQRLARGIYLCSPEGPSWEACAWAGVLLGGPLSRLGPEASGYLHGLVPVAPLPVDILIPHSRQVTSTGRWQFHRERPGVRPLRTTGPLPRLLAVETVLDLSSARTPTEVLGLVTSAVQSRKVTSERLLAALDRRSSHRHRKLIGDLLADVAAGAESPLEVSFLREVERPHGLPKGSRQKSRAGLPYVSDVGYDEHALLIELDGRTAHEGSGRFRDMERDNRFALNHFLTLRYGWYDVIERPCAVAWQIATVLAQRGWRDSPRRCWRCKDFPVPG